MQVRTVVLLVAVAVAVTGCGDAGIEPSTTVPSNQSVTSGSPVESAVTSTTVVATTTVSTTIAPPSTTAVPPTTTRLSVASLAAGLFCRDLAPLGYSYSEAVAYWVSEGSPDRMDADRNGIPCETVYLDSDVLAFWGDPLPTTTVVETVDLVFGPSDPWEYPHPVPPGSDSYGSGCGPGTTALPNGAWFGAVVDTTAREIRFDLSCLVIPDEGHPTVRNDNPRIRSIAVADGTVVYHLRMGEEFAGARSFADWRTHGCTTRADACPMWLFVNDGSVTAMVEVRLYVP